MRQITVLLLLLTSAPFVTGQALQPLYDGRRDLNPTVVSKTDEAVFKQEVLPAAKRAWASRQSECADGFGDQPEIRDVTTGSFTKPKSLQRAILYNYCTPAHAYAFNGIAIVENGRVVSHIVYQSDWQHAVAASPDVNENGKSELLVVSGTTNQGTTWATVTIIEFNGNEIQQYGFVETFSDSCGFNEKSGADAYRLLVKKGPEPEFLREQFRRGCNQRAWRLVKRASKTSLSDDGIDYRRLK